MSTFGDGTTKQEILDVIEYVRGDSDISPLAFVKALLDEVVDTMIYEEEEAE